METNNSENLKRLRHENDDLENCSKRTKTNILESNKSPHHRDNASHKSETPKTNRSVRRLVLSELSPNTNVNKKLDFSHQENALLSLKTPSPNAPVTPTTNFRLLTSLAASLSYAGEPSSNKIRLPNRRLVLTEETRPLKVSSQIDTTLGSSDTNISNPSFTDALECSEIIGSQSLVNLTDEESQDCNLSEKADRKKKALGLLCDRFLQLFTELPSNKKKESFHLAEIAEMLCVCKRRIYDVTIILNSLGIIRKIKCNFYKWLGKNEMIKTLKGLRAQAIELQQSLKIKEVTEMELNSYLCKIPFESENNESSELVIGEVVEISTRKDKGLSEMSKKFLMLFLESPEKRICLDIAAKALYPETSIDALKLKTRVRRLYDIANVLQSLELIKKEFSNDLRGRRSAFVYSGPVFWELTPEDAKNPSFSRNENVSVIVESVKNFSSKLSIKDECQSKPCKLLQTELLPCLTNEQSVTTRKLLKCKKNADAKVKNFEKEDQQKRDCDGFNSGPVNDTYQDRAEVIQIPNENYKEILKAMGGSAGKEINFIKIVAANTQTPLTNREQAKNTSKVLNLFNFSVDVERYPKVLEENSSELASSNLFCKTETDIWNLTESVSSVNNLSEVEVQNYFERNVDLRDESHKLQGKKKLARKFNEFEMSNTLSEIFHNSQMDAQQINLEDENRNFETKKNKKNNSDDTFEMSYALSEVYHGLQMVAEEVEIESTPQNEALEHSIIPVMEMVVSMTNPLNTKPNYNTPVKQKIPIEFKRPAAPVKKYCLNPPSVSPYISMNMPHEQPQNTYPLSSYVLPTVELKSPIFATLDPNGINLVNTLPEMDFTCIGNDGQITLPQVRVKRAVSRCLNMIE